MRRSFLLSAVLAISVYPLTARAGDVVDETTTNPFPGVELTERIEEDPNNRIYVARISLCEPELHVIATEPPTSYATPGSWGGAQGVQLATNGDFYTSGPSVYGDAVGGGIPWPFDQTGKSQAGAWYYQDYGWIAFGPDWVELSHTKQTKTVDADKFDISLGWKPLEVTEELPPGTVALVSGFPELVIEGQQYTCVTPTDAECFPDRSDMRDRHPRSAMGITADRGTFILVAVDGRDSPTSVGMYGAELAELMFDLGAWDAFNLDGGGSTAMWLQDQGYVNQPSDGAARAVANHWGVYAGPDGGQPVEPGSCFVPGGCFATPLAGAERETFKDMPPGSPAHDEAVALFDSGFVNGCSSSPRMYCPACPITRAQLVTIVVNAAGLDTANPPMVPTFDDVAIDDWFFPFVEAAVAAGLIEGCSATSFCPQDGVPRGLTASVLRLALGWPAGQPAVPTFPDVPEGHSYFGDIEALVEHCVAEPCDAGGFCPDLGTLRSDAAILIVGAFGLLGDPMCPDGGTSDTSGGDSTGTGANDSGETSSASGQPFPDTSGLGDADGGGCGCRSRGHERPRGPWLVLVVALGWRRRA